MRLSTSAFVVAAVTLLAGSARAHHNMSALFDFNDRVTVSGTLTRRDWRNPHIYVFVDGKTVTAEVSRARDGSSSGLLRVMTLPDGKVVSACPQNC